MRRILASTVSGLLLVAALGVSPAFAAKPDPFCPAAFTSGSDEALAIILTGFFTLEQVQSWDTNHNDTLCWYHVVGVGYQVLDDGTPR